MNIRNKYDSESLVEAIIMGLNEAKELEKHNIRVSPHFIIRTHVREYITKELYSIMDKIEVTHDTTHIVDLLARLTM